MDQMYTTAKSHFIRFGLTLLVIGFLAGGVSGAPLAVQDDFPENSDPEAILSYGATFQVGTETPLEITMLLDDGTSHTIRIQPDEQKGDYFPPVNAYQDKIITNSVLRFSGALNLNYYIHPRLIRYTDEQIVKRIKRWEKLPVASEREVRIEIRTVSDGEGVAIWLDGRYAGKILTTSSMKSVSFAGGDDALVKDREFFNSMENDRFLPLEYGLVAQPGAMQTATVSLQPGPQQIAGIPMIVSDGAHSGDIAGVQEMRGSWLLECDDYLSRTSFDGMPESQLVSIPQRFYHRAWVLFAVNPDLKKDPILTVRLTRFAGAIRAGRGEAIADTYLNLPRGGEEPGDGIQQVGTVTMDVKGETLEVPLYLAAVDIPLGEILGILSQEGQDQSADLKIGPYLDFEILGRRGEIETQRDYRHKPTGASSAANIFGVTLEKAPAEMRLAQREPGNIFHNNETPEMETSVIANKTGTYHVEWKVADIDGKQVQSSSHAFNLQAGEMASHVIPLQQDEVGHYDIEVTLKDAQEQAFFAHSASFALLPPDTREAGLDSPYSVWWFGGPHISSSDITQGGPLHLKAGLRRTQSQKYSEAEMAPYKMTISTLGWKFRLDDLDDFEAAKQRVYTQTTDMLARYPSCNNALIFHESHTNLMPDELAGLEPTFTDAVRESNERKAQLANLIGAFYREQFPQVELIVGNSNESAQLMADLFRFGFDPQYADYIGIESQGQTMMPEAISESNIAAVWLTREVARLQGYEIPLTGCYEFTTRTDRLMGARRQAEFYVRDILISHAYGFKHIGPGALDDAGGSYYNTHWGCGGLVHRSPLLYPKPAYVAVATTTRVLDKATCTRIVPTGSLTVYALEFARDRQVPDVAYSVWTPRGSAGLEFVFGEATEAEVVDMYGRSLRVNTGAGHTLTVEASAAAAYVIVRKPAKSISIVSRDFSSDDPPATFKPADTMADVNNWALDTENDKFGFTNKFTKPGQFEIRSVDDPERGLCMELELIPDNSLPTRVAEYTGLRLRKPVPLAGEPHTIGVWVKGNSNWGRIYFEVEDAYGRPWCCNGIYNDWPADLAVNFDGWRFLQFFIDETRSPVKNYSVGDQWRGGGTAPPKYPLRLAGLYVSMYRQAIDPVEMRDVMPVLRLQDVGAYPVKSHGTSVDLIKDQQFKIYPNPTSDMLYVTDIEPGSRIQVYNSIGLAVCDIKAQSSNESFSLKEQPSGLYIIVVSKNNKRIGNYKLIKN